MKGIIYKLECCITGEVYYGSTQRSLNLRMTCHKASCKQWKEGKCGFTTSFQIIDRDNYSYSLIETVECEDKYQLEQRERYYIENNECINKIIVGRTIKEYYEANKDKKKAYDKEHYEDNKEAIKEKTKEWYAANKDKKKAYDKEYREANKEKKKTYREANKDHIKELQRQHYLKQKLLKNI
jgi:hypothetical protein